MQTQQQCQTTNGSIIIHLFVLERETRIRCGVAFRGVSPWQLVQFNELVVPGGKLNFLLITSIIHLLRFEAIIKKNGAMVRFAP